MTKRPACNHGIAAAVAALSMAAGSAASAATNPAGPLHAQLLIRNALIYDGSGSEPRLSQIRIESANNETARIVSAA